MASRSPAGPTPPANIAARKSGRVPWLLVLGAVLTAHISADAQEPLRVLWKTSDPPVITSAHRGPVSFELVLLGDVPEVYFYPVEHTLGYDTPEKWTRVTTRPLGGHLTSVYQATFDEPRVVHGIVDAAPDGLTRQKQYVHYHNSIPLGYLALSPEFTPSWRDYAQVSILRVALNLPPSSVRRINAEAQYSSHVVNIVVPTYMDDGYEDLQEIARRFYVYFGDDYDTLGIIPHALGSGFGTAYHAGVQNQIRGLGIDVFDHSADFGSPGRLRSVHFYPESVGNYIVIHETAHQWWEFWDWKGVAGVENVDGIHGPEYSIPATGRQYGTRLVRCGADYCLEPVHRRDSVPYLKSPVTFYKMGYIGPEDVPEITVFETETRTLPGDTTPTEFLTPLPPVSINDFIARHGVPSGPVEGESWRMAIVVVTRDRLLSREMMSVYNFMAARIAALPGFGDNPSFFEATDGRMRMHTAVRPKQGPRLEPPTPVDVMPFMPIDGAEVPGVRFDSPLSTRILVGADLGVDGQITDESVLDSAGPTTRICGRWVGDQVNWWSVRKVNCSELSRSGRFRLEWDSFTANQVGVYSLRLSGFQELPVEIDGFFVTVGSDMPTTTSAGQDRLVGGQRLYPGQFIRARRAACRLELRTDGDLVAYADGVPYWNAGSGALAAAGFAAMQRDGNFVISDAAGAVWSTRTAGNPGATLAIQSDCNVVVRTSAGDPIWASGRPAGVGVGSGGGVRGG